MDEQGRVTHVWKVELRVRDIPMNGESPLSREQIEEEIMPHDLTAGLEADIVNIEEMPNE